MGDVEKLLTGPAVGAAPLKTTGEGSSPLTHSAPPALGGPVHGVRLGRMLGLHPSAPAAPASFEVLGGKLVKVGLLIFFLSANRYYNFLPGKLW